jgi:hypothetical protein
VRFSRNSSSSTLPARASDAAKSTVGLATRLAEQEVEHDGARAGSMQTVDEFRVQRARPPIGLVRQCQPIGGTARNRDDYDIRRRRQAAPRLEQPGQSECLLLSPSPRA